VIRELIPIELDPKFTQQLTGHQWRNEVRWRPGQEASLAPPLFEPEVFRKKMYFIKKVLASLLGVFGAPTLIWCKWQFWGRVGVGYGPRVCA